MDEFRFEVSVLGARPPELPNRVLSRDELRQLACAAENARSEVWKLRKVKRWIRLYPEAPDGALWRAFDDDPDDSIRSVVLSADPVATDRAYDWLAEHPNHPFELVEVTDG
jgi:hypothetical protein